MLSQNQKLAESLTAMHRVQNEGVVRAAHLSRTHRERLLKAGFLQEVVKGWLMVANPTAEDRSSAGWYASFWSFVAQYLHQRFKDDYCLSAEASLRRHVESTIVPNQIIAITKRGSNQVVTLPFKTSLLLYRDSFPSDREQRDGLWLMSLPEVLCRIGPGSFHNDPTDVALALRLIRDPSSLLHVLLERGSTTIAGRLAGAYTHLHNTEFAERIVEAMRLAGYAVRPTDPFEDATALPDHSRRELPAVARLRMLWAAMRPEVARILPPAPGLPDDGQKYLIQVEERYLADAYNSLSIEGYRVSPELIERVRSGQWNPQATDEQQQNALAARGYYEAFEAVKSSLLKIMSGQKAASIAARDHQRWYQELFAPAVQAGILNRTQLAGYRNGPVYLRGSRHVPPRWEVVPDCMEAFFELLHEEEHPGVRAVLGHFLFVYVHPYPDGNGRIGRFLMNALLAEGGYPWTVIHQAHRTQYLDALEQASADSNIKPFAEFVRDEMMFEGAMS